VHCKFNGNANISKLLLKSNELFSVICLKDDDLKASEKLSVFLILIEQLPHFLTAYHEIDSAMLGTVASETNKIHYAPYRWNQIGTPNITIHPA
jgi:hypothetical protein